MNIEIIEQPFEPSELKSRPGSYGKPITYAPLKSYIERMNEAFGYDWSNDVIKVERGEDEIVAIVKVTASGVAKTQAGSKHVTRDKEGNAFCLGDDTKAAISDGFKKCCQLFGIGLHLLSDEEDTVPESRGARNGSRQSQPRTTSRTVGGITEKQIAYIKRLRTDLGWSQDDVRGMSDQLFRTTDVASLNQTQASTLINELKKHLDAGEPDADDAASF
ncbi:MAG: Rad52/Rad22 family DNA repair protein [Candidatus Poribacteria bacterium]|nr:Rad52/Rad22 family DNA repair protein [Candidatus Poribacteria bacterium]